MNFVDRWADSKNARIHYLDCKGYGQNMISVIYKWRLVFLER